MHEADQQTVRLGDIVEVDLREPYPHTHRLHLLTPEAVAFANEVLAKPGTPWRKAAPVARSET